MRAILQNWTMKTQDLLSETGLKEMQQFTKGSLIGIKPELVKEVCMGSEAQRRSSDFICAAEAQKELPDSQADSTSPSVLHDFSGFARLFRAASTVSDLMIPVAYPNGLQASTTAQKSCGILVGGLLPCGHIRSKNASASHEGHLAKLSPLVHAASSDKRWAIRCVAACLHRVGIMASSPKITAAASC